MTCFSVQNLLISFRQARQFVDMNVPRQNTSLEAFFLFHDMKLYWKAIFCVTWPVVLLPVYLRDTSRREMACCYVVVLMSGYWLFDVLPIAVTAFIPMVLFPALGVLSEEETAMNYFHDANMMFISGLIIAIAVQYSHLHFRISLIGVTMFGCSPRKLLLGFVVVTMFISMWISNTATTVMMMPIIEISLKDMEDLGFCTMWEDEDVMFIGREPSSMSTATGIADLNRGKIPTKINICYHIAVAYTASIAGLGTVIGTTANLIMKGIYEQNFPNSPPITFSKWMLLCVPMLILMTALVTLLLEIYYLGLFRPNSKDAKAIHMDKEGEQMAKEMIQRKYADLGPWTFHEMMVGILFMVAIVLWLFRQRPLSFANWGWSSHLKVKTNDGTPAMLVVVLMFMIPAQPSCLLSCDHNISRRPQEPSSGLLTWKVVQTELPWGLVFLIGGGFALGDGASATGMCTNLADFLHEYSQHVPNYVKVIMLTVVTTILTQFISNCAVANILLPSLTAIAKAGHIHPLQVLVPATLSASFAFCMPLSTPGNAVAAAHCNMDRKEMIKMGIIVSVICLLVLNTVFPFLGKYVLKF